MTTTSPTAWPTLALQEFFGGSTNTTISSFGLFSVFYPANKLIARDWRDVFPGCKNFFVNCKCFAQIGGQFMCHTTGYFVAHDLNYIAITANHHIR